MWKQKYIAEGFEEDASKLLKDFVKINSVEFTKFAEIWKEHYFSLIFMGRPDQTETSEFTNEVYRITMHFLSSTSFYQRVGTIYLLYALYRNQIADPPIKIRIAYTDWILVKSVHEEAKLQHFRTLHYVIDYLIKNAFLYVANQTLKGPTTGSLPNLSNGSLMISSLKTTYKSDILKYSAQNKLKELRDLHYKYLELKKDLDSQVKITLKNDHEVYDSLISELDVLMNPPVRATKEGSESVGSRRAKIKAESFLRKTTDRFGQEIEDDNCETDADASPKKADTKKTGLKHERKPRKRHSDRRVGRPSKKPKIEIPEEEKSDDDNMDISHLINQQSDFYLPPDEEGKKVKNFKVGRYYCRDSPRRDGDGSDSSDPDS